jgi:hypothetical protein
MSQAEQYQQRIMASIYDLPTDKLAEVAEYVESLRKKKKIRSKRNIVKLGGLWKGVKITDKMIAQSKKEFWQQLDRKKYL